ncbi:surfactant B protein [Histomonas meleagridis]|uniref:surfactant B protein n=1 Tax=Histomonas meleagridis TaxID=135588 RepID=UPI00355AAF12|nr:surfactant B protein [Histomonas meleagridis]KAH0801409.1 surfactant B protein [Histomonas meleagridis]
MFALLLISALGYIEPIEIPEGLSNADGCSVCKTVIAGITDIMDNTKVQSAIAQLASELCKKFKNDAAQNLCKTIVGEYLPKVISYISKGISKANICGKLGLCKGNDLDLYDEDEIEYIEIPEGLENGIACSVCKHLVAAVAKILANTKVQSKVSSEAKKICDKLPKAGRDFCNSLISKYLPKIMNWLSQKVAASTICNKLKSCNSNDFDDDAYLQLYLEMDDDDYVTEIELPLGLTNADNCAICKKAVGFVSAAMKNSIVQAIVKAAATAACGAITSGVGAALCKTIVKVSVGPIMTWLGQKLSQSKICSKLGYCKGNDVEELDFEIEEEDDDELIYIEIPEGLDNASACSVCKTVVSGVVSIMKNTKVTSQIAKAAAKLCNKVPAIAQGICKQLVGSALPSLIKWIGNGLSNLNVCKKVHLC